MEGSQETDEVGGLNRQLESIIQGASLHFTGKIISNILGSIFNLILTRTLGATLYGFYVYANTVVQVFGTLARLGTGKSVLRFIPANKNNTNEKNWYTYIAYFTAFVSSSLIGIIIFVISPQISTYTLDEPLFTKTLRVLAIVLPFNTLANLTGSTFRAKKDIKYQVLIDNIFRPGIRILVVLIAVILGYSLIGVVSAIAVGGLLTFSFSMYLLRTKTDISLPSTRGDGDIRKFYNFSLPLTFKDIGQVLYSRIDILMVGFFLASEVVGIYRIAVLITTMLSLPLTGVNQLFPSIASDLYSNKRTDQLEEVYRVVSRWVFSITLLPTLLVIVYSPEVLTVFGGDFTTGSSILILFAIAQLTNSLVGPSGFLLMMTDHQYVNLANQWAIGLLNIILNYLFITEFGFIGAALATASTLSLINIIRVVEVQYIIDMNPYSMKYWKPLAAGVGTLATTFALRYVADGYLLLFSGLIVGTIVYLILLMLFGIEKKDRELFENKIRPYISEK